MGESKWWREQIRQYPIKSCGRLDMATYMPEAVTVGRVESDRVRYVYMENGTECIVLGHLCDHVAFRAADYDAALAERDAAWDAMREAVDAWPGGWLELMDIIDSHDPRRKETT